MPRAGVLRHWRAWSLGCMRRPSVSRGPPSRQRKRARRPFPWWPCGHLASFCCPCWCAGPGPRPRQLVRMLTRSRTVLDAFYLFGGAAAMRCSHAGPTIGPAWTSSSAGRCVTLSRFFRPRRSVFRGSVDRLGQLGHVLVGTIDVFGHCAEFFVVVLQT